MDCGVHKTLVCTVYVHCDSVCIYMYIGVLRQAVWLGELKMMFVEAGAQKCKKLLTKRTFTRVGSHCGVMVTVLCMSCARAIHVTCEVRANCRPQGQRGRQQRHGSLWRTGEGEGRAATARQVLRAAVCQTAV